MWQVVSIFLVLVSYFIRHSLKLFEIQQPYIPKMHQFLNEVTSSWRNKRQVTSLFGQDAFRCYVAALWQQMTTSYRHAWRNVGFACRQMSVWRNCHRLHDNRWQLNVVIHGEMSVLCYHSGRSRQFFCSEDVSDWENTTQLLSPENKSRFFRRDGCQVVFDGLNFSEIDSLHPTPRSKLPIMVALDHKIPFQMDQMIQQCLTNRSRHPKKQLWPIFL